MSRTKTLVNKERRFETGCIATLTDGETVVSRHFLGDGADSTRAVAAFCDRHGYRVVALSTPSTIYRDLQGWRRLDNPTNRKRIAALEKVNDQMKWPEAAMLGAIGRSDLFERP